MNKLASITVAALTLGVMACSKNSNEDANAAYANDANATGYAEGQAGGNDHSAGDKVASGNWPTGSRIVVDNGVTYRIEPGGVRVRLEPGDSQIVVDNGVRYRVDPGGTRVRIDETGAAVSVGPGGVKATVPVGGNTTVQVNTQ